MKIYLKVLACFYFVGSLLHLLDLLDLRLKFSEMSLVWQIWIIYLMVIDILAAVGLWRQKSWGILLFLTVAASQLIAYIGFVGIFGRQDSLIVFHVLTLTAYQFFKWRNPKSAAQV